MTSTVPRIAGSIEDFRDGQTVAALERYEAPFIGTFGSDGMCRGSLSNGVTSCFVPEFADEVTWVILADPPTPPVTVPADVFEALKEALLPGSYMWNDRTGFSDRNTSKVLDAARALIAAVEKGGE